jgi:AraC family transcriptional regulator
MPFLPLIIRNSPVYEHRLFLTGMNASAYTILTPETFATVAPNLKRGGNLVNFSSFSELDTPFQTPAYAIKFVLEGEEDYYVEGRRFKVKQGEFLLVNPCRNARVVIDSGKMVKGMCIDINPVLLGQAWSRLMPDDQNLQDPVARLFEHQYSAKHTHTGRFLASVAGLMNTGNEAGQGFDHEFFLSLAEYLAADQQPVNRQLQDLAASKTTTREELLRRLYRGKNFIEDSFTEKIDVSAMAMAASLSEFHFFRLFRQVFHCTPYQLLVEKRLQHAAGLIVTGRHSLSDIALLSGFSDLQSFSKSFKKRFGVPPSSFSSF